MPKALTRTLRTAAAATLLAALDAPLPVFDDDRMRLQFAVAMADDHDDDDDDDDDDDRASGGGRSGFERDDGGNRGPALVPALRGIDEVRTPAPVVTAQPAIRAAPPPSAAAGEMVALGIAEGTLAALAAEGFVVLERRTIPGSPELFRLRVPDGLSIDDARARIAAASPSTVVDANHYYRPDQNGGCEAQICPHWAAIDWPAAEGGRCPAAPRIGLVDTDINPDHEAFEGQRLEIVSERPDGARPSGRKHGTAVAALLVGSPETRTPGLLPDAELIAVDPFETGPGSDERTDAFRLVAALERLAARDVDVINLSLSGPPNAVLAAAVEDLTAKGIVMVAAVGNEGPGAGPRHPAALDGVIAVTAVDSRNRIYRRAVQGPFVDFAAPGVAVPTAASIRGLRPQTGTSFAAPFVTAAVAALRASEPELGAEVLTARLAKRAVDLGEPGHDPVFGHGLVSAEGLCPQIAGAVPSAAEGP